MSADESLMRSTRPERSGGDRRTGGLRAGRPAPELMALCRDSHRRSVSHRAIMKDSEAHARAFLLQLGLGPVTYEPDGNQPPDFVTADGTAVEVRRLNQHFEVAGTPRAHEYDAFPLLKGFRRVLESFGQSRDGRSWWVGYHFHRPVPLWQDLEIDVRRVLTSIDQEGVGPTGKVAIHPHFMIYAVPCAVPQPQRFAFSGYADYDAGGWLIHELQRNVQICAEEKTRKIAPYRERYARWWLVLIDHIGYGTSTLEAELIAEHVRVPGCWNRVTLLHPSDATRWSDIPIGDRTLQ